MEGFGKGPKRLVGTVEKSMFQYSDAWVLGVQDAVLQSADCSMGDQILGALKNGCSVRLGAVKID